MHGDRPGDPKRASGPHAAAAALLRPGVIACAVLLAGCGGRGGAVPVSQPAGRSVPPHQEAAARTHPGDDGLIEESVTETGFTGVSAGPESALAAPGALAHTIRRGQTLYSLSRAYGVPLDRLMRANRITNPRTVPAGMILVIPIDAAAPPARASGGAKRGQSKSVKERPPAARAAEAPIQAASMVPAVRLPQPDPILPRDPLPSPGPAHDPGGLALAWPAGGRLTAGFGRQRGRSSHEGIDIDGQRGQPVRAAAPGVVVRADEDGKYGKVVVIDHGGGIATLYAHANRILVRPGQRVDRNDAIAEIGRTGNASGHHLHFEIRRDGRPIDPLPALRSGLLRP